MSVLVARCLANLQFASFLLLSSTRVYARADTAQEDVAISLRSADPSDLYNLTKLAGEALCLACPRPEIRVARLSNVYGAGMSARRSSVRCCGKASAPAAWCSTQSAASAKDYVNIAALVRLLPDIAVRGAAPLQCRVRTEHQPWRHRRQAAADYRLGICFASGRRRPCGIPASTHASPVRVRTVTCDLSSDLPALLSFTRESHAHH